MRVTKANVAAWLESKPGLFEAKTAKGCLGKAARAFLKLETRHTGEFLKHVYAAGYRPRPTGCGGFILDRKP